MIDRPVNSLHENNRVRCQDGNINVSPEKTRQGSFHLKWLLDLGLLLFQSSCNSEFYNFRYQGFG
jgi:hypothetical protein